MSPSELTKRHPTPLFQTLTVLIIFGGALSLSGCSGLNWLGVQESAAQATEMTATLLTGNPLIAKGAGALMYGSIGILAAIFGSSKQKGK